MQGTVAKDAVVLPVQALDVMRRKCSAPPKCHVTDCAADSVCGALYYKFLCRRHWSYITEREDDQAWSFHKQWADHRIDNDGYAAFKEMVANKIVEAESVLASIGPKVEYPWPLPLMPSTFVFLLNTNPLSALPIWITSPLSQLQTG